MPKVTLREIVDRYTLDIVEFASSLYRDTEEDQELAKLITQAYHCGWMVAAKRFSPDLVSPYVDLSVSEEQLRKLWSNA